MAVKVVIFLAMLAAVAFGSVDWKASTEKGETLVESKSGSHYWTTKTSSFSQFTEIFHEYRMDSSYGAKKAATKVQLMSVSFVNRGTRYGDYADAYMTGGSSGYGSGSAGSYGSGSSAGYGSGSSAGGYGSGSAAGYGSGSSAGSYGSGSSAGYGSGPQGFPIRLNYVSQPYGRGSSIYWESQTSYGVKCKSKRDTHEADHLISELSLYGKNEGKAVVVTFAVEIVAAGAKLKLKSPNQFESYFTQIGVVKGFFLDMFSPAKDVILITKHVSDTKFLVFAIFNEKNYQRTATFNFKLVIRTKALIAVASGYGSGSSDYYGSGSSAGYGSGSSAGYGSGSSAGSYGSGSSAGYGSGSSAGGYGSGSAGSGYGSGSSAGYGSGSSAGSYGSGSSAGYGSGSAAGYGSGSDDAAYGLGYDFAAGAYGSGSSSGAYSSSDSDYDWSDY